MISLYITEINPLFFDMLETIGDYYKGGFQAQIYPLAIHPEGSVHCNLTSRGF
jgi:hypothetical protein